MGDQHTQEKQQTLTRVGRSKGVTTPQTASRPARPAIRDARSAQFAGSPVGEHVAYKQLCCLPNGNEPAIPDALRAAFFWLACRRARCLQTALLFA
ncbi:hypothetical protein BHAP_1779 [Bifidobacterium hapali]|uniref:Uncharacterized protein n=1 Tax=Bifidobacterium hapali TaxID=1630172 RepID=A0A261FWS1_9BIFI|nr:hypothetical protein BHAP_1779 [Bifidobacterium hapali]